MVGVGSQEILILVSVVVAIVLLVRFLLKRRRGAEPTSGSDEPPGRERARESIFLTYRRTDSADVAGRIYDRLVADFGRRGVFKDIDSIPLGVDFREHISQVLSRCAVVLAVIGPDWLTVTDAGGGRRLADPGDHVRLELEAALARRVPVVPLLVGGAGMPAEVDLPASLKGLSYRNGIPVRPDPDFHYDMDRLLIGLRKDVKGLN